MVYKLLKKGISLALAFVIVLSLSCCGVGDEDIILPDIVFVMARHFPFEHEFLDGTFIGTAGYYIDKNGEIKYFEFEDETEPINKSEPIAMDKYFELCKINEFHKKVSENSFDTECEPIPEKDLINYYKTLLKVDDESNLMTSGLFTPDMELGLNYFYGVRINENRETEYLFIFEYGNDYYSTNDRYSEKLEEQLFDLMHEKDIYKTWQLGVNAKWLE